jgi:TM2 domain-containing membrane protein YozV
MPSYRYDHGDRPLDGYTIEHALGRGGFGEVYYALSDSGRQVALKAVQNYEDIELRGISHCMNLKSPHLVSIFDVKHNDRGDAFVIMEYVAGPSLRELLDESPEGLGTEKAAWFVREMAKGLALLHDAGVVHRDLKPHNVFVEDGYVKVGDYSLSKIMSSSHRSGHTMTVDSVHYMAPEISLGRYDRTVDIYALGVMLYEMLTGRPPFIGETMGEVLMKHMAGDIDISGIEEPFAAVVLTAMAQNPEERYQSVDEMVEALFGVEHIQNSVSGFNPQSLTVLAGRAAIPAQNHAERATPQRETRPKVDRYAPRPKRAAAEHAGGSSSRYLIRFLEVFYHALAIKTYPRTVYDRKINDDIPLLMRCVLSLVAGAVGSIAIALLVQDADIWGYSVLMMTAIVATSALVSKFVTRRLPDAPTLLHRFAFVAAMGIPVLVINENAGPFRGSDQFSWAVLFPLFVMDWRWLTSPVRPGRVMLLPAVFAGIVASIAGLCFAGDEFPVAGAICAVAALMIQVFSSFDPQASEELAASSDWVESLNSVFETRREEKELRRRTNDAWRDRAAARRHDEQRAGAARVEELVSQLKNKPLRSEPPLGVEPFESASDQLAGSSSITLEAPPTDSTSVSAETIGLSGTSIESAHSQSGEGEPSSRVTALALAMLPFCSVGVLPFFGLHRFYVGKKVTGVLWLLTLGFCGVGQLIDALMIALGGFKDPQGRHLVSPLGVGDQKVNPLSTLPSPESMIHGGMNLLGGLLLAVVIPMGFLLALDLPEMIEGDVFRHIGPSSLDMARFFQMVDWKPLLWNVIATGLSVLGVTSLTLIALARRQCGILHVLRVPVAGAAFMGAFGVVMENLERFRWDEFGQAVHRGQFGQLLSAIFGEQMMIAMIFGPMLVSLGLVVLSWPPKLRNLVAAMPARPVLRDVEQTPAEQGAD